MIPVVISDNPLKTGLNEITYEEEITIKAEIAVDVRTGETVIRIPLRENESVFKEKAMDCLADARNEF